MSFAHGDMSVSDIMSSLTILKWREKSNPAEEDIT